MDMHTGDAATVWGVHRTRSGCARCLPTLDGRWYVAVDNDDYELLPPAEARKLAAAILAAADDAEREETPYA